MVVPPNDDGPIERVILEKGSAPGHAILEADDIWSCIDFTPHDPIRCAISDLANGKRRDRGCTGRLMSDSDGSSALTPTIDVHCHLATPVAAEIIAPHRRAPDEPYDYFMGTESKDQNMVMFPTISDPLQNAAARIEYMDRMGVQIQGLATFVSEYAYWAPPSVGGGGCEDAERPSGGGDCRVPGPLRRGSELRCLFRTSIERSSRWTGRSMSWGSRAFRLAERSPGTTSTSHDSGRSGKRWRPRGFP